MGERGIVGILSWLAEPVEIPNGGAAEQVADRMPQAIVRVQVDSNRIVPVASAGAFN
jgi:hypothetical protein